MKKGNVKYIMLFLLNALFLISFSIMIILKGMSIGEIKSIDNGIWKFTYYNSVKNK